MGRRLTCEWCRREIATWRAEYEHPQWPGMITISGACDKHYSAVIDCLIKVHGPLPITVNKIKD